MISKEIKFLLTHSSIYGLGTVVSQIVSFMLLPLYTRYLTPADYGTLETIDISNGIIGIVVTISIARSLSRFYYESDDENERNRVVSTTYLTYFAVALFGLPFLMYLSGSLSTMLLNDAAYQSYFRIGLLCLLIGAALDIGMMYLRLVKKPVIFISITVTRLLSLIALNLFFVVHLKMGVKGILYSSLIVGSVYATGLTAIILRKTGLNFTAAIAKQLLSYGLPMIPSSLGNAIVKQSDKYFVLYLYTVADMGIYSLSLKIGNAVHSLMTIPFNMAYIPRRFEIMKQANAQETLSRIFTYYIFLIGYTGLILSVLIPEVLYVMVTPKFYGAKEIVPLVVLSMVIFGSHYHFDFGILQSKKTKYLSYIALSCAVVQVLLNIALVGRYKLYGAVWSSVISLLLQAVLLYSISHRLYPIPYEFGRISRYMIIAFLFYVLSSLVHTPILLLTFALKVALLASFPIVLALLRVITSEEMERIKGIYATRVRSLFPGAVVPKRP